MSKNKAVILLLYLEVMVSDALMHCTTSDKNLIRFNMLGFFVASALDDVKLLYFEQQLKIGKTFKKLNHSEQFECVLYLFNIKFYSFLYATFRLSKVPSVPWTMWFNLQRMIDS